MGGYSGEEEVGRREWKGGSEGRREIVRKVEKNGRIHRSALLLLLKMLLLQVLVVVVLFFTQAQLRHESGQFVTLWLAKFYQAKL